jgi:hypothetical protein
MGEQDKQLHHPDVNHSSSKVREAIEEFPNAGRFFNMLTRGIAGKQDPSPEEVDFAWNRVAFTNYVDGTVGDGSRERPTSEMWEEAKSSFFDGIRRVKPRPNRIIVLGLHMWGKMPDSTVHYSDTVQEYDVDGDAIVCLAVSHPAGRLSWGPLAGVIHFTYRDFMPASRHIGDK